MRRSYRALVDSFHTARGDFEPLFSHVTTPAHVHHAVRRYILHRSSHLDRLSSSQRRSWRRGNLSLVLNEARRRQSFVVAQAALRVALEEGSAMQPVDSQWVKDALAACSSVDEVRQMKEVLLQDAVPPSRGGDVKGSLLATLAGASNEVAGGGQQLGDSGENVAELALSEREAHEGRPVSLVSHPEDGHGEGHAVRVNDGDEIIKAIGGPSPARRDGLLPAEQRTRRALDSLHQHREQLTVTPNASFSRYFIKQGIVHSETEVMQLAQSMRARPQEVGFRVHLSHPFGLAVQALLRHRVGIQPVSWLPESFGAYTLDCSEKVSYDSLLANRQLLRALGTEQLISYQSVSSMLPVCWLQPKAGDVILDVCASPGSKTQLLVDYITASSMTREGCEASPSATASPFGGPVYSGCVFATEVDARRARDVARRLANISPLVSCVHTDGGALQIGKLFDKVLVDAPCSGEGRMGREQQAWRLWHPLKGTEFHARQVRLLRRAVELCRVGGTVVYATCTLNPMENEAVVGAVLRECKAFVELVPPPNLPAFRVVSAFPAGSDAAAHTERVEGLRLSNGLRQWYVPSSSGGYYTVAEEAVAQGEAQRLCSSLFSPTLEEADMAEALHRCCRRVLPHQNGGAEAFFVAVLRRTSTAGRAPALTEGSFLFPKGSIPSARTSAAPSAALNAATSVLYARGLVGLPFTNMILRQHLGSFFSSAGRPTAHPRCTSLSSFLQHGKLSALWNEEEGLRLVGDDVVEAMRGVPTQAAMDKGQGHVTHVRTATLNEVGVLAVTRKGELTECGAAVLRPYATARVFAIPVHAFLILLTNRQLEVGPGALSSASAGKQGASIYGVRGMAANVLTQRMNSGKEDAVGDREDWSSRVMEDLQNAGSAIEGNAIVTVDVKGLHDGESHDARQTWAWTMAQWAVPIRVEVMAGVTSTMPSCAVGQTTTGRKASMGAGSVRFHLLLTNAARHRYSAMVGRLQAATDALPHRSRQLQYMRESAMHSVRDMATDNDLRGDVSVTRPWDQAHVDASLPVQFTSSASSTVCSVPTPLGGSENAAASMSVVEL